MNHQQREAIRQAKILRALPDPTGLGNDILGLVCKFKINNVCQTQSFHLEYEPTGEVKLPAPSCNGCHNYLERAFQREIASGEANMRIRLAILMTYEALMQWDQPAPVWTGLGDK